eukprot:gb/GECG01015123.1/.p1 GENE.gb/GECG01015123.1/~~gb/GECG01015123.1/.p1  ORF type:complete len:579 (+),score=129.83 gb/GECG01015123.1/:1-1737(+)
MSSAEGAQEEKNKGNKALQEQRFDEAIAHYNKAIELDPSQHVFFSNRSAAYLSKGDAQNAFEDANKCVEIQPNWPKGYSRKGAALHALGRYDEAITTYDEGLKQDPNNDSLKSGKEEVLKAKNAPAGGMGGMGGMQNPFGPDMFNKLALHPKYREYLNDPDFKEKLTKLQRDPNSFASMIGEDNRIMEVLSYLMGIPMGEGGQDGGDQGHAAGATGAAGGQQSQPEEKPSSKEEESKPQKKETPEEKEERERKERAEAKKNEGNQYYKKKEFDKALELYDEAMEIDPHDIRYRLNKAAVYTEQKNYEKAIQECQDALEYGRENKAPFAHRAKALERLGNIYKKREMYDEAIQAYEDSFTESYSESVNTKLKECKRIKKRLEEEAYRDPEKGEEAREKGNEYFKDGKFTEAIESYTEAIKRNPDCAKYYYNRGTARTKIMDFYKAYEDINKALEMDPNYVKAWARKGNIEFVQKEYHKAIDSFKKGLELDKDNYECQDGYQRTIMKINESQSGETDQERVARAASDPEIQQIMRDPMVSQALQDMQNDPQASQRIMSDPHIGPKIEKLVASGILQTKSQ